MDKYLKLEIVSPERIVLKANVKSVTVPGIMGEFQVLYNHEALVSTLGIGRIKVIDENEVEHIFSTSGGVIEIKNNSISLLAETIETPDTIDINRAQKSKERAEKRINDSKMDKERAFIALERAKNRLRVAGIIK